MGILLDEPVIRRVHINERSDGYLDFEYPPHTDEELHKGILELMKVSNNVRRGLLGDDQEIEAQVEFFDKYCRNVGNLDRKNPETGQREPCNAQTCKDWKKLIPPEVKASSAAYFSRKMSLSAEEKKVSEEQ